MPTGDVARAFDREMYLGYETLKRDADYNAVRFKQMLDRYGGVGTAKRLLTGAAHSAGLDRLALSHRLGESVEATVRKPAYDPLFSDEEREIARRRLVAYEFDVDGFLARLERS